MVVLSLTPYRGNHARFFPHTGYLGVTPVVIQGIIRTKLEEDRKPLKAESVSIRVRCYEADISNVPSAKGKNRAPRVIYELSQEIWTKDQGQAWGALGEWALPWRVVLPVDAGGVSTSTFKNWKSWWQVEAVVLHKRSAILGCRTLTSHQVPLTRYSATPTPLPSPSWTSSSSSQPYPSSRPPTPPPTLRGFRYSVSTSSGVLGPNDPLQLKCVFGRDDPSMVIKKIQVSLDRHIVVDHFASLSSPAGSDDDEVAVPDDDDFYWTAPVDPHASPVGGRAAVQVLTFEADDVPFGTEAVVAGVMPKRKSTFHYSIGETLRTKLVNVSFSISVKIFVKTASGAPEVVELEPRTVIVTAASDVERNAAWSQTGHLLAVANAEVRLFEANTPGTPLFSPSLGPPRTSALGARRSAGLSLSAGTPGRDSPSSPVPSLARSVGSPSREPTRPFQPTVRRRSEQWDGYEAPLKSKPRFDRGGDDPTTSFPSQPAMPPSHHDHGSSHRRTSRQGSPYSTPQRPQTSSGISMSSNRAREEPSGSRYPAGRFQRELSAPLPSSSTSTSVAQDILLPLSLYSSEPLLPDATPITIPLRTSPAMSNHSTASSDSVAKLFDSSPSVGFHSISLTTQPVPFVVKDPSRLSVQRPSSAGGDYSGRRKSSFGLFGKTVGGEAESPKEGGRWGFLRRGSKV